MTSLGADGDGQYIAGAHRNLEKFQGLFAGQASCRSKRVRWSTVTRGPMCGQGFPVGRQRGRRRLFVDPDGPNQLMPASSTGPADP